MPIFGDHFDTRLSLLRSERFSPLKIQEQVYLESSQMLNSSAKVSYGLSGVYVLRRLTRYFGTSTYIRCKWVNLQYLA